jgi:hypothetical protein
MREHVRSQIGLIRKAPATMVTTERPLPGVNARVPHDVGRQRRFVLRLAAVVTKVQRHLRGGNPTAPNAAPRLPRLQRLQMRQEAVRPHFS